MFPHVSYTEGLAYLKAAAMHLKLGRASEWGTHAFRRGWANEALKAGGATALFYSGGWRGVAAFSYVEAKARGALEAAEWLVKFSDSSDEICLESQSSRVHWVQRFFTIGPISTLGRSVTRRTVRSLSAASKPRITQRTTRYTPSIQVEGAGQIFRVREFRFLLSKLCVAHSVAHSFTFLLCCALSVKNPARGPEAV